MTRGRINADSFSRNEWRERQQARGLCIDCMEPALQPNKRCARHLEQVRAAREKRQRQVAAKRKGCMWLLGVTADERLAYYAAFSAFVKVNDPAELNAAYALGGAVAVEQILYAYADKSKIWSLESRKARRDALAAAYALGGSDAVWQMLGELARPKG